MTDQQKPLHGHLGVWNLGTGEQHFMHEGPTWCASGATPTSKTVTQFCSGLSK
jgi:hypothetical protein